MFFKRRKQKDAHEENDWHLLKGGLDSAHICLGLVSHHGIPKTSSKLAFDPMQRLLAIGTLDGRIKLIGRNGVEGILISPSQSRCKFLEFANNQGFVINITAENDLQVWDLEKRALAQTHRWHTNVMAFVVIQGGPFMYIGEDTGDIAILQYDKEERKFRQMPYYISCQTARGGLPRSDNNCASVVGILPFQEAIHNRVVIAYSDGVIIVWEIHKSQALSIMGIAAAPVHVDEVGALGHVDEEDEKDICCLCWADLSGGLLVVGYTDGDIWVWDVASSQSSAPFAKLQLASSESRSPILALRWCGAVAREASLSIGGNLFVYGGGEFGCSETLTICALNKKSGQLNIVHQMELPLEGLFEDMILLPGSGGLMKQASALLVLTSESQVHAYDMISISKCLEETEERSDPCLVDPVPVNPFRMEPSITVTRIFDISEDVDVSMVLSQLPRHVRGNLPSVLPGGTKWPISGGCINRSLIEGSRVQTVLIIGHADGSVIVWDASTSVLLQLDNLPASISPELSETVSSAVSHLEFCPKNGILAAARGDFVSVYRLSATPGEASCLFLNESEIQHKLLHQGAGFHCIAVLHLGIATVSSIAIANQAGHVAVCFTNGMVLFYDPTSGSTFTHKVSFPEDPTHIRSLNFGPSLRTFSESGRLQEGIIYAATEDSCIVAMVYGQEKAAVCGPWPLDQPSKFLSLHCLEPLEEKKDEGKLDVSKEHCLEEKVADEGKCPKEDCQETEGRMCYLVLCTQTSAYLYRSSVSHQRVSLIKLQSVHFSTPCSYASVFATGDGDIHGLVLLDVAAFLNIRSIPDLELMKQVSLARICNLDPKLSEKPTFASGKHGLAAVVDAKRELTLFSFLLTEESLRVQDELVSLFDRDVAAAGEAALNAGSVPSPRRKSQLQGLIGGVLKDLKVGGVLKELKGGLLKSPKKEEPTGLNGPDDLLKIFSSPLMTEKYASIQVDNPALPEASSSDPCELDIDDIDIEDEEGDNILSEKPSASSKGKEKVSDSGDERAQLFDGDDDYNKPVRRSPDEIRAKYGHKPLGDVSGVAGLARDKLLERQEKLQALGKRTEELQDGAQNFASMAAELAKTMEGRKWWQL